MNRNRAFVPITLLSLTAVLCPAAAARAQSDFAGTWALTPDEAAVGNVRFCVLGSSVVVHGSGEVSPAGTVTYASGSVDANGVLALTIRATNSQTNLRTTRVFAGNLSLTGTSSGTVNLTDTSGTDLNSDWAATLTSSVSQCSGSGAVPLSLSRSSLPRSIIGVAYQAVLTAKGGIPPYTFAVAGLPAGLTFDPAGALITGLSPSGTAGSYPLQIILADDVGRSTQGQLVLVVGVAESGSETTVSPLPCAATSPLTFPACALLLGLMRFRPRRLRRT